MCNDRRATVQKVDMSGSGPKTVYSFNPAAWQFWAWLVGTVATAIIFGWGAISFVAGREFDQRLRQFHGIAKPSMELMMDKKMNAHAAIPAHGGVIKRLTDRETHDAATDATLKAIQETQVEIKAEQRAIKTEINRKLDILLRQ